MLTPQPAKRIRQNRPAVLAAMLTGAANELVVITVPWGTPSWRIESDPSLYSSSPARTWEANSSVITHTTAYFIMIGLSSSRLLASDADNPMELTSFSDERDQFARLQDQRKIAIGHGRLASRYKAPGNIGTEDVEDDGFVTGKGRYSPRHFQCRGRAPLADG